MTSNLHHLTPAGMAAIHEIDPSVATDFVKKFFQKAGDDSVAMANLFASGLLGKPGEMWDGEIRERVEAFVLSLWGENEFESGSARELQFRRWMDEVRPIPEDRSFLLFAVQNGDAVLYDFFVSLGADPNLPVIRSLNGQANQSKQSHLTWLITCSGEHQLSPHLKRRLAVPADDLPCGWIHHGAKGVPPKTVLDVALTAGKIAAAQAIIKSCDMSSPKVAQKMTDSLTHAIDNDKHLWALRLLGAGAEPAGGDWARVISFFEEPSPQSTVPRILNDFKEEAADKQSFQIGGRPAICTALERLAKNGMNLNVANPLGNGMVGLACHSGHTEVLETLLDLGAEYRSVLASLDREAILFRDREAGERGRRMLQARAARDTMSAVIKQTKASLG